MLLLPYHIRHWDEHADSNLQWVVIYTGKTVIENMPFWMTLKLMYDCTRIPTHKGVYIQALEQMTRLGLMVCGAAKIVLEFHQQINGLLCNDIPVWMTTASTVLFQVHFMTRVVRDETAFKTGSTMVWCLDWEWNHSLDIHKGQYCTVKTSGCRL